jgi:hypothetical protein
MKNASFDEQLKHAADELDSNEARAKRILNAAKTAEEEARGASAFERAEHWNPATNTDIGTRKTARGVAEIESRLAKEYASKNRGTGNENETSGGLREWIEQQRAGAHHQHRPWDVRVGHHHQEASKQAPSRAFWMEKGGQAVARHPYLVGEKGPELFVPRQSGEVIPNNANFANLRAMLTRFASGANFARMRELIVNGGAFGHYRAAAVAGPYHEPLSPDLGRYIARRDGVTTLAHKVTGDASLRIDLMGFPKGTKTKAEINGLFKTLTIYRGLAAPMADQEG